MAIKKLRLRVKVDESGYDVVYLQTSADLVEGLEAEFTSHAYSHPTYTQRAGVPTENAAPGFGGTFTVTQPVSDGLGHITAMNSRTITIPNAVATSSANGLMSSAQVQSLAAKMDAQITDDATSDKYRIGFNNGAMYYEAV